ncbi:MAG: bifunctional [glutamate--ammonia ligase]-adenylyl-L-tyrosine phosphorylase/[glutamate--ammonia-ligase] adenylyltransferase, partial [Polyangiaceae bacterium]|nr:bifunctional [glutamate--ammonia ligase]-adenylyl-L-tyrosine phosphorylase/[glutamate--ammonia-ligase] adenylyltransferase [Polyangiaceae bacterium]
MTHRLVDLARSVDPQAARDAEARFAGDPRFTPERLAAAVLAVTAYPSAASRIHNEPQSLDVCVLEQLEARLERGAYLHELRQAWPLADEDEVSVSLRRFARAHRLRIALREMLPAARGESRFEATAAEISDLASATIQVALERALLDMRARYGTPLRADGAPSTFAVLGMGKLGGRELNVGSDVDLIFVYDTDDGEVRRPGSDAGSLHEFWSRVARRLVALLDDVTDEGFVWRVDLRLRPEGTRGALVNSVAAMLRYYEAWGRQWERAVLLRSTPVAGDIELGANLLHELEPFVFRRRVDPTLADTMIELANRARVELSHGGERDLKLGEGGIREVELFVQALQLIWGGVHAGIRVKSTLEAVRRLLARGLVTEREAELMDAAYVLLRRAEHVVQHASGLHTHLLPADEAELGRVARTLGYADAQSFAGDLRALRERVHTSFASLSTTQAPPISRWTRLLAALDAQENGEALAFLQEMVPSYATPELARDLAALAQRPDSLLGAMTRERHPGHGARMLDGILASADPEMAARHLRVFFAHPAHRALHASIFSENPQAALRFVTAVGASAFVGELLGRHPELGDQVLFSPGMPNEQAARAVLDRELARMMASERLDLELVAGAIRRAKMRVLLEVALA